MPRKTSGAVGSRITGHGGFNEAAARCRGKPPACERRERGGGPGFNEAAARCRGKPRGCDTSSTVDSRLQ